MYKVLYNKWKNYLLEKKEIQNYELKFSDDILKSEIETAKKIMDLEDLKIVTLETNNPIPPWRKSSVAIYIEFDNKTKNDVKIVYSSTKLIKYMEKIGRSLDFIIRHELAHVVAARNGAKPEFEHEWIEENLPEYSDENCLRNLED